MNAGDIAFPNLGIYLKDVPRSFHIFGFEIAFYGLIIGIGMFLNINDKMEAVYAIVSVPWVMMMPS